MFGEKKRTYEKEKNARSVTPYLGKKKHGNFFHFGSFFFILEKKLLCN